MRALLAEAEWELKALTLIVLVALALGGRCLRYDAGAVNFLTLVGRALLQKLVKNARRIELRLSYVVSRTESLAMTPAIFLMALATSMPTTNLDSVCRSAEAGGLPGQDQVGAFQNCLRDEKTARDELKRKWGHFSVLSRTTCAEPAGVTFSYVEFLTCLEMQPGSGSDIGIPETQVISPSPEVGTTIAK
jgi:hypothetical protein